MLGGTGFSVSGERAGETTFAFDSVTGRLATLTSRTRIATSPYSWQMQAQVAWLYDLGGRETQRTVTLGSTSGSNYPVVTTRTYDVAGRESTVRTTQDGTVRYEFKLPSYSGTDDLLGFTEQRRDLSGGHTNTYSTDGTRRLLTSSSGATHHGYNWTYDVFGNRVAEIHTNTTAGSCNSSVAMSYATGADNRMKVKNSSLGCTPYSRYLTDQAGMRLGSIDSTGGYAGIQSQMTYTAAGQLYLSVTPTSSIGTYDYNWHWYDASGMRFMSHVTQANSIVAAAKPDSGAGLRTYYVYDGSDVALTLVKQVAESTFRVQQRYATVGIDEVVAGRYWVNGLHQNLAIIGDRQGSTITARKADGTEETRAQMFDRNAYGALENAVNGGATGEVNTGTGFTGASNPNATGGFTYLRNRWYDPQTGRFLSQDPIGLAGGVNLYAYAGNNPSSFSDPFGLCTPMPWCLAAPAAAGAGVMASAPAALALGLGIAVLTASPDVGGYVHPPTTVVLPDATATFASSQAKAIAKTTRSLDIAQEHLDRIGGLGPNDRDPDGKKRDWIKHAQKHLNNARKFVDRAKGKTADALRQRVEEVAKQIGEHSQ